jgi:predicted DNA-binding WGR domain protein
MTSGAYQGARRVAHDAALADMDVRRAELPVDSETRPGERSLRHRMARMRRFEFVGGTSSKFWEIGQTGSQVTVRFGRIGTNGQTQVKDLDSWDAAAERVRKLIGEKLREGYQEVGTSPTPELGRGFVAPSKLPPYEPPPLPADGPASIAGINLPPGRRLEGDPDMAPRGVPSVPGPVFWATNDHIGNAGRYLLSLRAPAAAMNLVPMMLVGMASEPRRPWDSREFAPTDPRRIDAFDARAELSHAWASCFEDPEEEHEEVAPYGSEFPGLAAAPAVAPPAGFRRLFSRSFDPLDDSSPLAAITGRRLALVAASRPADAITAIGWMGAVNVHNDPALMSAILRSWEDRWLARVVEIGFDTLKLTVGNPPTDLEAALALAAEHFAFCPDNVWQGVGTIRQYAPALVRNRVWDFWWD